MIKKYNSYVKENYNVNEESSYIDIYNHKMNELANKLNLKLDYNNYLLYEDRIIFYSPESDMYHISDNNYGVDSGYFRKFSTVNEVVNHLDFFDDDYDIGLYSDEYVLRDLVIEYEKKIRENGNYQIDDLFFVEFGINPDEVTEFKVKEIIKSAENKYSEMDDDSFNRVYDEYLNRLKF